MGTWIHKDPTLRFFILLLQQFGTSIIEAQSGHVGDAMWHLPKFGDKGWFLHASDGRVRACNMDKVSVVGDKPGPRCSNWR